MVNRSPSHLNPIALLNVAGSDNVTTGFALFALLTFSHHPLILSPMSRESNQALIERWKDEPAPLLPLLHAFHNRDGYLSDDAIKAVSEGLRIPLAELFGCLWEGADS